MPTPISPDLLKALREFRALSQADLAERTGISVRRIQRFEQTKEFVLSVDDCEFQCLITALNVAPMYLSNYGPEQIFEPKNLCLFKLDANQFLSITRSMYSKLILKTGSFLNQWEEDSIKYISEVIHDNNVSLKVEEDFDLEKNDGEITEHLDNTNKETSQYLKILSAFNQLDDNYSIYGAFYSAYRVKESFDGKPRLEANTEAVITVFEGTEPHQDITVHPIRLQRDRRGSAVNQFIDGMNRDGGFGKEMFADSLGDGSISYLVSPFDISDSFKINAKRQSETQKTELQPSEEDATGFD